MRHATCTILLFILAACRGGGEPAPPVITPPTKVNSPPVISSAKSVDVTENRALSYTLQASDPDGDALTYSVIGTDAFLFNISTNGAFRFKDAPNFELPVDANGDNIYNVTLSASDGSLTDSIALVVHVLSDREGLASGLLPLV